MSDDTQATRSGWRRVIDERGDPAGNHREMDEDASRDMPSCVAYSSSSEGSEGASKDIFVPYAKLARSSHANLLPVAVRADVSHAMIDLAVGRGDGRDADGKREGRTVKARAAAPPWDTPMMAWTGVRIWIAWMRCAMS